MRTGSLTAELAQQDPELLALLLEDYISSTRRDRASRVDFASGWLAAFKRLAPSRLREMGRGERLPW